MSEGAWLEVCDGKGLLVEAQLRGLTYSNKAFATASANPQQVSASTSRLTSVYCVPCTFFGEVIQAPENRYQNRVCPVTQLSRCNKMFSHDPCSRRDGWFSGLAGSHICTFLAEWQARRHNILTLQVPWEGPRWEVVAALGGLKGGRADTLVEKISELGARSLRPLLTHRSRTIGQHSTLRVWPSLCASSNDVISGTGSFMLGTNHSFSIKRSGPLQRSVAPT